VLLLPVISDALHFIAGAARVRDTPLHRRRVKVTTEQRKPISPRGVYALRVVQIRLRRVRIARTRSSKTFIILFVSNVYENANNFRARRCYGKHNYYCQRRASITANVAVFVSLTPVII